VPRYASAGDTSTINAGVVELADARDLKKQIVKMKILQMQ